MSDVSPSNIINLVVTAATASIAQRAGAAPYAGGSIKATYDISVRDPSLSYTSLSSQLSTAVSDGEFTTNLQSFSTSTGATGFATASSTSVTTTDLLDDDNSGGGDNNSLSTGAIAGIVIGCAAFVIVIAVSMYYFFSHRATASTNNAGVAEVNLSEVGNPMGKKSDSKV